MQSSHRGILDLDSGRVLIGVERSAHTQALRGGGAGDQVDDDLVAFERASAPVAGNVRRRQEITFTTLCATCEAAH